jgi:hypothetical protein
MRWLAPLHHPASTIHHGATKTGGIQRIVERGRHAHISGISNDRPLAKDALDLIGHPAHAHYESWKVQQEEKTVIRFDTDHLYIVFGHQLAK